MDSIRISKMTKAQMHEFFKEFTYDPATFAEQSELTPYVYDQQSVDAYYERHKAQGKLHFAILRADAVIGDLYLKHIDYDKRTCELGIHMVNDRVKNKGYGTKSIQLLLSYAFTELEMEKVFADCLITNPRSQRALIKAGFRVMNRDETNIYYVCSYDG